jgi:hypothetical protein
MKNIISSCVFAVVLGFSGVAFAETTCTTQPEKNWLSEPVLLQKIAERGYRDITVSRWAAGNCYEIYGKTEEGENIQVLINPINGHVSGKNTSMR